MPAAKEPERAGRLGVTATPRNGGSIAVAGLGAIGLELVRHLHGGLDGLDLVAVSARDSERARARLSELGIDDVAVVDLAELVTMADIVIECLPSGPATELVEAVVDAGKEIIVLSAGVLLDRPDLIDLARIRDGRITVPTGALLGLDAVAAAAMGGISSVKMTTRKPARGLAGAPHLVAAPELLDADQPVRVFGGSASEAVAGFPANLNVAAALALAGVGPDRTEVEVWIDPTVTRNTHTIVVRADVADLTMTIENVPSDNPRTGRITALSVINLLRKRHAPLSVGS
jgi:aspartate dehydrogenase